MVDRTSARIENMVERLRKAADAIRLRSDREAARVNDLNKATAPNIARITTTSARNERDISFFLKSASETRLVTVPRNSTIKTVKEWVQHTDGTSVESQVIIMQGKPVSDTFLLSHIPKELRDTLFLRVDPLDLRSASRKDDQRASRFAGQNKRAAKKITALADMQSFKVGDIVSSSEYSVEGDVLAVPEFGEDGYPNIKVLWNSTDAAIEFVSRDFLQHGLLSKNFNVGDKVQLGELDGIPGKEREAGRALGRVKTGEICGKTVVYTVKLDPDEKNRVRFEHVEDRTMLTKLPNRTAPNVEKLVVTSTKPNANDKTSKEVLIPDNSLAGDKTMPDGLGDSPAQWNTFELDQRADRPKKTLVTVKPSLFVRRNQTGDFLWEIKNDVSPNTLYIFNDNENDHYTSNPGGGNGAIRPYNKFVRTHHMMPDEYPRSAGICTGPIGGVPNGYTALTPDVKTVIDRDIREIKTLLQTGQYSTVAYSRADDSNLLGTAIFNVDPDVIFYITEQITSLGKIEI